MNKYITIILFFTFTFLMGALVGYTAKNPVQKLLGIEKTATTETRGDGNRQHQDQRMRNYFIQELNLENAQIDEFFEIMHNRRRAIRQVMEDSQKATREKMRAHSDSLSAELKAVLNEEQFQGWQELQQSYERRRGSRDGRGNR